jgi:hypothetical protein
LNFFSRWIIRVAAGRMTHEWDREKGTFFCFVCMTLDPEYHTLFALLIFSSLCLVGSPVSCCFRWEGKKETKRKE